MQCVSPLADRAWVMGAPHFGSRRRIRASMRRFMPKPLARIHQDDVGAFVTERQRTAIDLAKPYCRNHRLPTSAPPKPGNQWRGKQGREEVAAFHKSIQAKGLLAPIRRRTSGLFVPSVNHLIQHSPLYGDALFWRQFHAPESLCVSGREAFRHKPPYQRQRHQSRDEVTSFHAGHRVFSKIWGPV